MLLLFPVWKIIFVATFEFDELSELSKANSKMKFNALQRQLANATETLYQSYSFNFQEDFQLQIKHIH